MTRMASRELVTLRNGRRLAVHLLAEGTAERRVVLCHPAPGSGGFDPDPEVTWDRGVTVIGVDRPGYGESEPVGPGEWLTVGQAADDLAEVLELRGTGPVEVAGWSVGGLVALALAAHRDDLVDRVAVIGAPAPDHEVGWNPPELRTALTAAKGQSSEQVHSELTRILSPLASQDPDRSTELLLGVGDADEAALERPGARQRLHAMLDAAFTQGTAGLAADLAGYSLRPWGFEPEQVKAKVLLLYAPEHPSSRRGLTAYGQGSDRQVLLSHRSASSRVRRQIRSRRLRRLGRDQAIYP